MTKVSIFAESVKNKIRGHQIATTKGTPCDLMLLLGVFESHIANKPLSPMKVKPATLQGVQQ